LESISTYVAENPEKQGTIMAKGPTRRKKPNSSVDVWKNMSTLLEFGDHFITETLVSPLITLPSSFFSLCQVLLAEATLAVRGG
jgi:hypothetical protein